MFIDAKSMWLALQRSAMCITVKEERLSNTTNLTLLEDTWRSAGARTARTSNL
jgi:hypothetical protein